MAASGPRGGGACRGPLGRAQGEPPWADPARTDLTDGLKYQNEDRWVYVRVSMTEPLIRVISEAPTPEEAQRLTQQYVAEMRRLI